MASILQQLSSLGTAKAARVAPLLFFSALILGALGWQTFQLTNTIKSPPVAAIGSPKPSQSPQQKKSLDKNLLEFFGSTDPKQPEQIRSETLPDSNLDLQISAIFLMTPQENSSAIIEDGSKTLILKPGEEARPGIVIAQIESNRITFKRNGKLEQLSFRGFSEGMTVSPENPTPTPPAMSEALPTANPDDQPQPTTYQQFIQRKLAQNK